MVPVSASPNGRAEPVARSASRHRPRTLLIALVLGLLLADFGVSQLGLFGAPGCVLPGTTCTRVLFIGDSYTYVNDLPTIFADLAWSGGHRVDTETLAAGGESLAGHVADSATASTIASEAWNSVVLQDQSEDPALSTSRETEMYPAVTQLVGMIRRDGAEPLLFLTWAHQSGWAQADLSSYSSMQAAVDQGYLGIASHLGLSIAPVGDAWQTAVGTQASPELWQEDGVHPTIAGTYLAACVFYATVFQQSPVRLGYDDGLPAAEATMLQRVAASTVLKNPIKWGL